LLLASCGDESGEAARRAELDQIAAGAREAASAYAQTCAACHGDQGQGNEELKAPSIAGLPAWYIAEQFRKFREGERGVHAEDLPGQQMRAIALSLSEEQIESAAAEVAAFPLVLTELPPEEADLARGRYLFANQCMDCHRYTGMGERFFHSAQLVSLNRSYLRRQLRNFHEGRRGTEPGDATGAKMADVTARLKDEEIELLVDYIGALAHGDDPRPARER
jgi:cytochrome c553